MKKEQDKGDPQKVNLALRCWVNIETEMKTGKGLQKYKWKTTLSMLQFWCQPTQLYSNTRFLEKAANLMFFYFNSLITAQTTVSLLNSH